METVLLNTRSAIESWERGYVDPDAPLVSAQDLECISGIKELRGYDTDIPPLARPVCIAANAQEKRNKSSDWRCQVWSRPFPPRSVHRLNDAGVCVSSPWFCFLQMAPKLNLADAIRLGMELCGTHSTLPFSPGIAADFGLTQGEWENGFVSRPALLTADRLRLEISRVLPPGSRSKALVAARHVVDNARSPGESRLYMLLCLPVRYGGYGLPKPALNVRIGLSQELREVAGKSYFLVDLYYPQKRLAIEYDGGYHWKGEQRMNDNLREAVLREQHVQVLRIDKKQLENRKALDMQAREIAGRLGIRRRPVSDSALQAREKLRGDVLNWASDLYRC